MVIAWSSHCCSEPCPWVPCRGAQSSVIDSNQSFSWGTASSHASSSAFSSTSSNPCGGACLRFSPTPPQPPPLTLYLPPHLSTYPPVNPPPRPPSCASTAARDRSHSCPQANHPGASRISEEADCSLKDETDERAHEPLHFAGGPLYPARASHPPSTGANLGKGGISPVGPPQNQNTTSKLVSPTSPYTRGSYKGAGGFTPAGAAPPPSQGGKGSGAGAVTTESDELGSYWQLLDDDLKPTMPQPSCPHSQQIFDEHNELAHQLLVVQEEIVYLDKKKSQMLKKLEEQERDQQSCRQRYSDKISQLKSKNESLRHDHSRLSHQLEEIRARRQKGHHHQQQQNPQNKSSQQNLNNQRLYHHHHQLSSSSHISPSSAPSSQFPHVHIPNQLIPSHPSHQSPLSQQDHSPQHLQHLPQRQQPPQQSQHYYYDNHPLYPHHNQNQ